MCFAFSHVLLCVRDIITAALGGMPLIVGRSVGTLMHVKPTWWGVAQNNVWVDIYPASVRRPRPRYITLGPDQRLERKS